MNCDKCCCYDKDRNWCESFDMEIKGDTNDNCYEQNNEEDSIEHDEEETFYFMF